MEEILIDCIEPDETALFPRDCRSNGNNVSRNNNNNGGRNDRHDVTKVHQRETEFIHTTTIGKSAGEKLTNKWTASALGVACSSGDMKVPVGTGRTRSDSNTHSAIMMYSPDIPSASHGYDGRGNLANYYTLIETEESVKCVVSTILFILILVAIFLVAIFKNPQM